MIYSQKYTPPHCLFCNFADWIMIQPAYIRSSIFRYFVRQGVLIVLYLSILMFLLYPEKHH